MFPQLNAPPRLFPCLRFAVHLAMPNAKLGAKVDRYSFLVRILHSLLHTGLARRTNIPIALTTPESARRWAVGQLLGRYRPRTARDPPPPPPPSPVTPS